MMIRPAYLLIILPLLLAGCGEEKFEDLQEFVKNSGKGMRGQVDPPPQIKPYVPFNYDNSAGLQTPFMKHKAEISSDNTRSRPNQPNLKRRREPLEEFPLDSLGMVGFLYQLNVAHAIIRAPDGRLHRVIASNHIGQNFGEITEITETEILIKEMVQDSAGDWSARTSSLQLVE